MGVLTKPSKVENAVSEFTSKHLQEREHHTLRVVCQLLGKTAQSSLCAKKGLLWGVEPHTRKALSPPHIKDGALERDSIQQSLGQGIVALRRQKPAQMKT